MEKEITILQACPEDAKSIAIVQLKTWQISYADIFPADKLASLDGEINLRNERWRAIIQKVGRFSTVLVAENSLGEIIGFCYAGVQVKPDFPQDAEVFAIYILPEYQGKKIGRRLMSAAARVLRQLEFTSLLVWVLAENSSSRGFYEHLGGRFSGEDEYLRWGQTYKLAAYAWDSLDTLTGE